MSTINPQVGPANASLSSPLITPGYPLVSVEKSSPHENSQGKQETDATGAIVTPAAKRANAVHSSGHDGDRSL